MTWLATPFTIQRLPFTPGDADDYGNITDTWGDPLDTRVHGWSPPAPDDVTIDVGRLSRERILDLLAPVGTASHPKDHWVIPGESAGHCHEHPDLACFIQDGHNQDFSHGPFGFKGGLRIRLKRVEG